MKKSGNVLFLCCALKSVCFLSLAVLFDRVVYLIQEFKRMNNDSSARFLNMYYALKTKVYRTHLQVFQTTKYLLDTGIFLLITIKDDDLLELV